MAEVQNIAKGASPPEDQPRIVIEHAGGRFVANGFSPGKAPGAFWAPPAFESLEDAIEASIAWADQNNVATVYVKGTRANRTREAASMKVFAAEVLLSDDSPGGRGEHIEHWVVWEDSEERAIEALMQIVPNGAEILMPISILDASEVEGKGLEPGAPKKINPK
jgi:hypothetical protein